MRAKGIRLVWVVSWWLIGGLGGAPLVAQTDHNAHLWLRGSLEVQTSERWLIRHETYFRRSEWGQTWQQIVNRSALQFRSPSALLWSVGYAFHVRYPYGLYNPRYTHTEHQFMLMNQFTPRVFERVTPSLRTRYEYRWLERQRTLINPETNERRTESYFLELSRIRFQLGVMYTFDRAKRWRFEVYNEDFFNFDRPIWRQFIRQNRFMFGFTHRLGRGWSASAMFLHQWINPTEVRDEQNFTLFLSLNWRIKVFKRPPPPPDALGAED